MAARETAASSSSRVSRPTIIETARRPSVQRRPQAIGDGAHMIHEAFLGQEDGGDQTSSTGPPGKGRDEEPERNAHRRQQDNRHHAFCPSGTVPC
jgi:hypothetical protein